MQTPTENAGFRLPLAVRIFLLIFFLLSVGLGSAYFITQNRGEKIAERSIDRTLNASAEVQAQLTERRLDEVTLKVQVIGQDPSFVQYVSDSQGGGLNLGSESEVDSRSLSDVLKERQQSYHFDLGVLLDPEANVLTRTDETDALKVNLKGDPFIESALSSLSPIAGFWRQGSKLYQAAIYPLQLDQHLTGFVVVAIEVNNDLCRRIGKASGSDLAFLLPVSASVNMLGSSLDENNAKALAVVMNDPKSALSIAVNEGKAVERMPLQLGSENWIARLSPVDTNAGARLGSVLRLTSQDSAARDFRELLKLVGLVAVAVMLVAIPLSFFLARVTLAPLRAMASAAKNAAAGNYQTHLGISGNDELAELSHSFDSLLSDLREKSDMAGYVNNLSRFLPDPGQEQAVPSFVTRQIGAGEVLSTPAPAALALALESKRESLALVGLDFRDLVKPFDSGDVAAVVEQASKRVQHLIDEAASMRGHLLFSSGQRALVGFSGAQRMLAALHFVRSALTQHPGTAIALSDGEVSQGSLSLGIGMERIAAGTATALSDRLLVEAPAGRALLSRAAGDAAKPIAGDSALKVAQGIASGKSFYSLDAASLQQLPPAPTVPAGERPTTPTPRPSPAAVVSAAPRGTELVPGNRLGGRYEILAVLGAGGMGVVYKARDLELDDVVALKMLRGSASMDAEQMERLKSEIKLARKITHPNVLRTFDFGDYQGLPYISMEYVRGMTLRYLLSQAGRLPYSAGLRIARQLCAGLTAAHEVGVVHRDIKPENLILEQSGNVKLMDFGIARPIRRDHGGQTQPGMFVGTPAYSAPEQLAGEETDHRADIYSSGVLLCEVFSGKLPFAGNNTMEIYLAQMQQQPIRPSANWPEIPPALENIILKSIAVKPDQRFQSAAELALALAQLRA